MGEEMRNGVCAFGEGWWEGWVLEEGCDGGGRCKVGSGMLRGMGRGDGCMAVRSVAVEVAGVGEMGVGP